MSERIAVVGSRDFDDLEMVRDYVRQVAAFTPDATIVSGGARGVDRVAVDEARKEGLKTEEFMAEWNLYGKSAGYRRNEKMLKTVHTVVAFHDGTSRGTQHSIDIGTRMGLKVSVITPDGMNRLVSKGGEIA